VEEVLHILIDVVSGVRNLAGHQADDLHDKITPGYSTPPPTDEAIAAAQAVLAAQAAAHAAAQARAETSAPAAPAEGGPE